MALHCQANLKDYALEIKEACHISIYVYIFMKIFFSLKTWSLNSALALQTRFFLWIGAYVVLEKSSPNVDFGKQQSLSVVLSRFYYKGIIYLRVMWKKQHAQFITAVHIMLLAQCQACFTSEMDYWSWRFVSLYALWAPGWQWDMCVVVLCPSNIYVHKGEITQLVRARG